MTRPSASIVLRAAAPAYLPTPTILPPDTATSALNAGAPDPSTTRPFLIKRSYAIAHFLLSLRGLRRGPARFFSKSIPEWNSQLCAQGAPGLRSALREDPGRVALRLAERAALAGDEFGEGILGPGAAHDMGGEVALLLVLLGEVLLHLLQQQRLDADHRGAVVAGDRAGELHRLGAQLGPRHQVVEQADAVGLLRLDDAGGKQQLLGDRPADLVGQGPGAVDPAVGGGEKAEARVLAADAHVERGGEHRGAAVSEAVDHADGRLLAGGDLVGTAGAHRVELFLGVAAVVLALLVDVAAGGNRLVAGVGGQHRIAQLARQQAVHRVELVGPVQGQDRDAVFLLDQDMLVGHAVLPQRPGYPGAEAGGRQGRD